MRSCTQRTLVRLPTLSRARNESLAKALTDLKAPPNESAG